jgi:Putative 2OG-Fe(II) oxygenase
LRIVSIGIIMTSEILNIFHAPLMKVKCDIDVINECYELLAIDMLICNTESGSRSISINNQVMNDCKYQRLRNWIAQQASIFATKYLSIKQDLFLMQSWLVQHNGFPVVQQPHLHKNSLISGTFYLEKIYNDADIAMLRDHEDQSTDMHSRLTEIKVSTETGDLILFPAHVPHYISATTSGARRTSLGFDFHTDSTIKHRVENVYENEFIVAPASITER